MTVMLAHENFSSFPVCARRLIVPSNRVGHNLLNYLGIAYKNLFSRGESEDRDPEVEATRQTTGRRPTKS